MTTIIVLLSVILFVLIYTFLMLKNALNFILHKLFDIDTTLEKLKLSKNN